MPSSTIILISSWTALITLSTLPLLYQAVDIKPSDVTCPVFATCLQPAVSLDPTGHMMLCQKRFTCDQKHSHACLAMTRVTHGVCRDGHQFTINPCSNPHARTRFPPCPRTFIAGDSSSARR
ncbi:hypothetical protein MJO28_003452 [Puccinia striiformis f. sp. tritici]|uniref:Uncharacterized protein n=3 Tax=Puccinia striiformis TaxID=27350 RepID=A0A0L0VTQ4_9BASI|nr:hypothetical protein Pst134EA_004639 [Puccinia striiformis f. sp. tritici]KAI9613375.1 hypothetical protein H4Q26_009975 [Puccinia striiformis f. sp. tritici PST-130]KNF02664.1 hypothetical protein PSTG_04262 [Puccinia striiformis f. sp. tritici PST-78]POW08542.1 hypothetical protein PSTT_07482 [Puccinia striiformis]KAH9461785.1 hypothetical protein Pst134EB_005706 [Puccinia striiformis f. sp. tritici]KAH9470715.1 hypothetical protein Pst134EA_004639 [Puccinia striiformis f. sp. tritici]